MGCPLYLPLADHCGADREFNIPADTRTRLCTVGYARGICDKAGQSEADAVRFLIKSQDAGGAEIAWSLERDHFPVAVGTLRIRDQEAPATALEEQAKAFLRLLRP